jgi:hypothetical protein
MPFRCKCTFIFDGPQKGWTETLYIEPLTGTFAEASTLTNNLCTPRALLLGSQCAIKAYRVQVVQDAGGLTVKRRGDTIQRPFFGNSTQTCADADLALLLDFVDAPLTRHKSLFLRGIWDAISQNYGAYTPVPAWEGVFESWRLQLIASGFGWVGRTPLAFANITTYAQSLAGFVNITLGENLFLGVVPGTIVQVNVQGLQSLGGRSTLNGSLLVRVLTDTTCVTVKQIAVLPFVAGGTMQTFTFGMIKTAFIGPEKIVTRETGAPLLESPGRQKARSRV